MSCSYYGSSTSLEETPPPIHAPCRKVGRAVPDLVKMLARLFVTLCSVLDFDELQFNASPEEFTSKKITTKILQQIEVSVISHFLSGCFRGVLMMSSVPQEPLALASGALPDWCEQLTAKCPFLIPFETRQLYFTCTAFGASR